MNAGAKGLVCALIAGAIWASGQDGEWQNYGRDPGAQRFSPLKQIDRTNVGRLHVAWTMHTGDAYAPKRGKPTQFEATPLYIDGMLYLSTPLGRALAIDPVSGAVRWSFDAQVNRDEGWGDYANRGVSTWKAAGGRRRILLATIDARLIALDAATGKLCEDFGERGSVDLRKGLRIAPRYRSDYEETSPPAVIGNTIVIGSAVADNGSTMQASGEVRGYDAATGKLKWTWDPIPQNAGERGADTWKEGSAKRTGAANAWSAIAADPARGLVFVPTGSASPDYYGGERPGDNLFANSVVALRAETGELVWHFQTVHHDLWDFDVATPPVLYDVGREGTTIPAIAVGSKTGNLFILNRETGRPVFGVEERPVAKSDTPGETAAPTQPFPVKPAPITIQKMTAADAWGVDEQDRKWCHDEIAKLRSGDIFTPPSVQGTLSMPGNIGGQNWGGMAYDADHDLLILPENHIASEVRLIPREQVADVRADVGRRLDGDWEVAEQKGTPYGMMRRLLLSPRRLPCTPPPWSTLVAIEGRTGEKKWEVPLGRFATAPPQFGSISLGGPIATAGGLVFVAGTLDKAIYAFDVETGQQLWRGELPTSGKATPMTYLGPDGKQYVVISAGGYGVSVSPIGDSVVAFSL